MAFIALRALIALITSIALIPLIAKIANSNNKKCVDNRYFPLKYFIGYYVLS